MNRRLVLTKLIRAIVVLLGISFISYLLLHLAPGDPARALLVATTGRAPSDAALQQMREQLGLNRPFIVQYTSWLLNCLKGDFGTSISQGKSVASLLLSRLPATAALTGLSLGMMLLIAIPVGIIAAMHQNKFLDYVLRGGTFLGISMPNFWVGLILLYVVAMKMGLVPVVSVRPTFSRLLLPAFTLAFAMSGKYARQVRAAVLEEWRQDYVMGARARGLSELRIMVCHVLPNAMLPLITLLGLSIGSLLGGTAVVEVIFSYPALGSMALAAITAMDYPLIQGYVLWLALIYMVMNYLVDVSYRFLDPRLRQGVRS